MSDQPLAVDVVTQKGGVGKTIASVNIADHLTEHGDVLLVDADPDGNATDHLGMYDSFYKHEPADGEDDLIHYGHLMYEDADHDPDVQDLIVETEHGFDFLPTHKEMGKYQTWIDDDPYGIFCFENNIVDPLLGDEYDFIIFDSTNSKGALFQDAAMTAAPNLIIPMLSGPGSEGGLHRLLTGPVQKLKKHRDVEVLALMPNRFKTDGDERELIKTLNENHADKLPPFAREEMLDTSPGAGIRQSKAIDRAWRQGTVLSDYDPDNVNNERFAQLAEVVANGGVSDGE